MKPMRIGDFPPHLQTQIRLKLGDDPAPVQASCVGGGNMPRPPVAVGVTFAMPKARRQPNQTERLFAETHLPALCHYEAFTFRLPGGSRYTPDWAWWRRDRLHVAEVKGSYHLHSHGRARTAFMECVAAFPAVSFWWAAWTGHEWKIEKHNDPSTPLPT